MGFKVTKQIEVNGGRRYDEFYVRIEHCRTYKYSSVLGMTMGHYDNSGSAQQLMGDYIEDDDIGTEGILPVSMSIVETGFHQQWPLYYEFHITSSEIVTVDFEETRVEYEEVEFVDFDENGNEIISTRLYPVDVYYTGSVDLNWTKREIGSITDLYGFAYTKIKETYGQMFGNENIIDII